MRRTHEKLFYCFIVNNCALFIEMGKEFEICRDIESFCSFVKVCHRFDSVENTTHYSLFLEAFKNASDYK